MVYPISKASPLSGSQEDGTENAKLLITWLVPVATNLHPGAIWTLIKSHFINISWDVVERNLL